MEEHFSELYEAITKFSEARNWGKFHSPKNLAMALSAETGELLDFFQWMSEDRSKNLSEGEKERVAHELADVFIYFLLLCGQLNLNPSEIAFKKLKINESKYPVDKWKGRAKNLGDDDE